MNKNTVIVITVVILAIVGGVFYVSTRKGVSVPSSTTATKETSVAIENFAFNPPVLTVKKGSTVTWTQKDSNPHTVTAVDGSFTSQNLSNGDTFSFTFDKAGEYDYKCNIHSSMTGKVIVE